MLTHIIYLAVALFYQNKNSHLGRQILLESWPEAHLPDEFLVWWKQEKNRIHDDCYRFNENGIHFTYLGCWDYPSALLSNLDSSPLWLSYLGQPNWFNSCRIAVVGSRKISKFSIDWMNQELVPFLKQSGATVVSGGARGVDQLAHLSALRAKSPTQIFLPSGLNRIYPRELVEWREDVLASGGMLISEYWPDTEIKKYYFIQRNRLIAAMADFVLVIQGEDRSGTLLTAKWALDLGRELGVVPGHPMDSAFSGNLSLLRSGVTPVIDHKDLLTLLPSK